jgi:NADH:ubiquinone oxidoreductase subunit F (NADH-binding)
MRKIHSPLMDTSVNGGYEAAKKALAMDADAVIQLVKDSGLRGPRWWQVSQLA